MVSKQELPNGIRYWSLQQLARQLKQRQSLAPWACHCWTCQQPNVGEIWRKVERESERSMNKQVCLCCCDKYHISTLRHPSYIVVYFGSWYEGRKLNRRAVEINIFCHREQHCVPSTLLVRFRMASYTSLILKMCGRLTLVLTSLVARPCKPTHC
jgi:hypothetical protein